MSASDLKGKGPGATLKIKRGKLKGKATGLKVFHRGDICIYIYIFLAVNRKRLWPVLSRAIGALIKRHGSRVAVPFER